MKILKDLEQGSQEWKNARLGTISGTRLASAIGTTLKQDTLINELLAEILTDKTKDIYVSPIMARGSEAEEYAIQEYEEITGEITEKMGLCISDEFEWLVVSPDRFIEKERKYKKAVEVKCPNTDTHIKYIRENVLPKEYEPQVIDYFLVNEDLEELDFVSYDPRIQTEKYRLWIYNVKREDLPIKETKEKLLMFWSKYQKALQELNLTL